jgi:hypothetical protein
MVGGKVSPSAPLYPSVVMNGGAHPFAVLEGGNHPFAVLEGGNDNWMQLEGNRYMPAQQVQNKLDRLLNEVTLLSTTPAIKLELPQLKSRIQGKVDILTRELKEIRDEFYKMDNAKTALSTEPNGPGVDPNFADLAARGAELNKKTQKVANSWEKVMTIGEQLELLVSRLRPKPLMKGGLHDAFKN